MVYRVVVSCLLLLAVTDTEVTGAYLDAPSSTYCTIPPNVIHGKQPAPTDLIVTCNRRRQEYDESVKQAVQAIRDHIMKQMQATDPIQIEVNKFTADLPTMLANARKSEARRELDELRTRVLVAAIEAGRVPDALAQYFILGAWAQWEEIVDRIYKNPNPNPRHIENLLGFIRAVPGKGDRLDFYHQLKKHMVEKKEYESYLGAMFAQDARHVVFDTDGKTPLNDSDVAALHTTMIDGAARYFRRVLLTGEERYDLILLDRNYPELFDLVFEPMFNISAKEMKLFDSWQLMKTLCRVYRPMAKARMFKRTAQLLVDSFKWEKQNEFYAPMLAGYLEACLPQINTDPATKDTIAEVQNVFSKFKPKMNYQSILKIIDKAIHTYAA
ncbi:uncharacterized protein LOC126562706 [Anopheles maculipalpis]|uniref:uncharacterized protein LOC126562706 n=1 Tax=Anopheles maculipalpis TaxID=1496333 RepID=UPI002159B313|nr:uncharacterized protein LOC126562706 [Anopheles maculipalpis]